jgi:hypothetical protein
VKLMAQLPEGSCGAAAESDERNDIERIAGNS